MGDLSPHFSRWEFDCPHCGFLIGPDFELMGVLENLRSYIGRELVIVSGVRCAEYNARVASARASTYTAAPQTSREDSSGHRMRETQAPME
jgi:hypothetical protein